MKPYFLGIDLGTTQVKAVLFDLEGNIICKAQKGTYPILAKYPNWAEQDAHIWWENTADVIRRITAGIKDPSEIACVSVSSQGMAMLPLDENGNPLCNAHIWMDRRAVKESAYIEEKLGREYIKEHFGAYCDPYYQVTNILWYKNNCPDLYARTRHIVKANTWLNFRLTGKFAIDETQAVMSLCYDIITRDWSDEMAAAVDIPLRELLPEIRSAKDILGEVTKAAEAETGLVRGTPVLVSSVDSALALLEMNITGQGDAAEITGTSSNNFFASETLPPADSPILWFKPLIETAEVPNLLFAPTNTTGEALRWTRNLLGYSKERMPDGTPVYDAINQMAGQASCGCSGLLFYPYLLGERAPLWSNTMRGMYIGASLRTTQGDMLRAVYEGTSFALREICEEAQKAGASIKRFRIGGGCTKSELWMRIRASVLGMPVEIVSDNGGAPKGNAILGGYALGYYKDFAGTVREMFRCDKVIEPVPEWEKHYKELYPLFSDMRNHLTEDLDKLAEIAGHR